MRSRRLGGWMLIAVWFFATGASVDGVREAREWQHAGDVARLFEQDAVAHQFYSKTAETFPGTTHGRYCRKRARSMWGKLRKIDRTSALGDCTVAEMIDFLTW